MDVAALNARAVGACTLEELRQSELQAKALTVEERRRLGSEWDQLTENQGFLRIYQDGRIHHVDECFFDEMLINASIGQFRNAAHIVGQVLGESPHLIGDTFLNYRLRELIANFHEG